MMTSMAMQLRVGGVVVDALGARRSHVGGWSGFGVSCWHPVSVGSCDGQRCCVRRHRCPNKGNNMAEDYVEGVTDGVGEGGFG